MFRNSLFVSLATLIVPACGGSPSTSTTGQMITCTTDPSTGVVLRCVEGGGDGGSNECHDIDTDDDGDPHDTDSGQALRDGDVDDDDGDGIPNDDDCDNHPGEDDNGGDALPYDIRPQKGATTSPIADAFLEKGSVVPTIDSVTMDGGSWRLAELQAGTAFVVGDDDCNHAGNRDVGRDRVVVTWTNADGTTGADHLDIRYCKGGGGDGN
jgi:hypothetical protein